MHRAALQDVADRVGGTWHRQAGSPEPGTDRTIRVGVLSRLSFTTLDPVAPFPDKLRAIQQGDGRPDEISTMAIPALQGRPALHMRVHADGTDIDLLTAHFKSKLLTSPTADSNPATRGNAPASPPTQRLLTFWTAPLTMNKR